MSGRWLGTLFSAGQNTKWGHEAVTTKKSVIFVLNEILNKKRMKRFLLLTLTALMAHCAVVQAQIPALTESSSSDLQARFKAAIEIPLGDKWSIQWGEQIRAKDSFGTIDKILSSLTLDYEPWKWLEVGGEYAFVNEKKGAGDWRIKHRINFNATGKLKVGRFDLSLRERIRLVERGYQTNEYETPDPFTTLRTRLKVAYNTPTRWKPYAYAELYTTLNAPKVVSNFLTEEWERDNYINRVRLVVGSELKLSAKQKMDLHYMLNLNRSYKNSYDKTTGDVQKWALEKLCAHVICVEYKFSL